LGADRFVLQSVADSTSVARDQIVDFVRGVDKLDLSLIDASTRSPGDQAFNFVGTAAITLGGQLRIDVDTVNNKVTVQGDYNADLKPDFFVEIFGVQTLSASDFIL
jgi:hypothetical protein